MKHELKIKEEFFSAIKRREKTFEVRVNDRGYQKGDIIVFTVLDHTEIREKYPQLEEKDRSFEITYILNGWGIKEDHVVFSIAPITELSQC